MRTSYWASLALIAATFGVPLSAARAETPASDLTELRQRLDALEAENRNLRETVTQRLPATDGSEFNVAEYNNNAIEPGDDKAIKSVVEKVLKEQDAKKKEAEEKKKKEDAEKGYEVGSDTAMTANWKNGVELSTKNKDFRLHIGGRYQFDAGWFDAQQSVQNNLPGSTASPKAIYGDGVDFRRARFRMDGTMYETIDFAAEFDFVNSDRVARPNANNSAISGTSSIDAVTGITDLWWTFTKLPTIGNVRVGNQKEAIGFEHLVSSRYLPFMERSYNQDTFYGGGFNGFTPGISMFNTINEDRGSWNLGVYKPANNVFAATNNDGDYSVTGRVTALPWYVDDGRGLLHLGFSGRQASTFDNNVTFRTRDAIRTGLSQQWAVPASINVFGTDMQWYNTEVAATYGSWTLQGEYLVSTLQNSRATVAGPNVGQTVYHGGYIQLLYFLTGESDNYSFERATFDRVKPRENFFLVNSSDSCRLLGRGAWQMGSRYNYLNLNDKNINGGQLHNFTTGLNWFLNPNMKMQFNYMFTYRDAAGTLANPALGDGWVHGWGVRWAHDF